MIEMAQHKQLGIPGYNTIYVLSTSVRTNSNAVLGVGNANDLLVAARNAGIDVEGTPIGLQEFNVGSSRAFHFRNESGFFDYTTLFTPIGNRALAAIRASTTPFVDDLCVNAFHYLARPNTRQPYAWAAFISHPADNVEEIVKGAQETYVNNHVPGYSPSWTGPIENRMLSGHRSLQRDIMIRKGLLVAPEILSCIEPIRNS